MQSPKNSKKQTLLHSPGTKQPDELTPILLLPHEIEREIFLKKIESLQYSVREQKTINARIKEELRIAHESLNVLSEKIKFKDDLINALNRTIKSKYRIYKDLDDAYNCLFKDLLTIVR